MSAWDAGTQVIFPVDLLCQLQELRAVHAVSLAAAAAGDYARAGGLRNLADAVGLLLAQEARKSLAERGGVPMLELSLAVDRFFPELRGWSQHEALRRQEMRMRRSMRAPAMPPAALSARRPA